MPEQTVSDPIQAATVNLNRAQDQPVKKGQAGIVLALSGIGYALIAIADEMRKANAK
jgi:hypothetical protein